MQGAFCHNKKNKNGWLPPPTMDEYEKKTILAIQK